MMMMMTLVVVVVVFAQLCNLALAIDSRSNGIQEPTPSLCYRGFKAFNDKTCKGLLPQLLVTSAEACAAHCASHASTCFVWTFQNTTVDGITVPVCSAGYCTNLQEETPTPSVGCARAVPDAFALREKADMLPVGPHRLLAGLNIKKTPALAVINDTSVTTVLFNTTGYSMRNDINLTFATPQPVFSLAAAVGLGDNRIAIIGGSASPNFTTTTTATTTTTTSTTTTTTTTTQVGFMLAFRVVSSYMIARRLVK